MEHKKDNDLSEVHLDNLIYKAWNKSVTPNSVKLWQRIAKSTAQPNYVIWKSIAAVLVIALLTAASLTIFNPDSPTKMVEVTNTGRKPKEVLLNDGSKILLNRNSSISYSTKNTRVLNLNGEAFFEVTKDKDKPFTVNTGELNLRVLGTSFNVNAYKNAKRTLVSLVEGKLKVTALQSQEKYLSPGDELVFNKDNKRISLNTFDSNSVLAWKSSLIKCENTSLDFLMVRLENYYNIQIDNKTDYSNCVISGEFRSDLSLAEIMEIISFSHNIEFTALNKNRYKIEGNICE